jgi:hypothetical protein
LLNLRGKLRVQRLEDVHRHLGKAFPDDMRGRDFVGGNVVTEFPASAFKYEQIEHRRSLAKKIAADYADCADFKSA